MKKKTTTQAIKVTETKTPEGRTVEAVINLHLEGFTLSDELAKGKKILTLQERLEKAITEAVKEHEGAGMKYLSDLEERAKAQG